MSQSTQAGAQDPQASSARHDPQRPAAPKQGLSRSFGTARTVWALMLREMSTRYGRSPGGYVWAIIEPMGTIFLLAIGFSLIIRSPSLGNSFVLFYATGFLPFHIYQQLALMVARSLTFSRPLLYYPAVSWFDAVLARAILHALTGIMVSYLIMMVILAFTETRAVLDITPILLAGALAIVLGIGIGVLNCALTGLYPTWELIWSIATRPLFLASGIIFVYEDMPRVVQEFLWYNPLLHLTGIIRSGFYPMYAPQYVSVTFVVISALIPAALGLMLLHRHHRAILENG